MYNESYWSSDEIKNYFIAKSHNLLMETWLRKHRVIQDGIKILDIGCGYGRNLIPFSSGKYDIYCFDSCADAVLFSKNRFGLAQDKYTTAAIQDQPWKNNRFDLLICDGVLHQVSTTEQYVSALHYCAHLLKDGFFFLSVFTENSPPEDSTLLAPHIWRNSSNIPMILFNSEEISEMLGECGFRIMEKKKEIFNLDVGARSNISFLLKKGSRS